MVAARFEVGTGPVVIYLGAVDGSRCPCCLAGRRGVGVDKSVHLVRLPSWGKKASGDGGTEQSYGRS